MQCGKWHQVGAILVALVLTSAGPVAAESHVIGSGAIEGSSIHDSAVIHDAGLAIEGICASHATGVSCGLRSCAACASKASYWYLPYTEQSRPDVFYNFYVPNSVGMPAGAYPAPIPTPPHIGHTYYTYQPLMPHEFLYKHHRSYHQFYNNGMGLNRTHVKWQGRPLLTGVKTIRHLFRLPR